MLTFKTMLLTFSTFTVLQCWKSQPNLECFAACGLPKVKLYGVPTFNSDCQLTQFVVYRRKMKENLYLQFFTVLNKIYYTLYTYIGFGHWIFRILLLIILVGKLFSTFSYSVSF